MAFLSKRTSFRLSPWPCIHQSILGVYPSGRKLVFQSIPTLSLQHKCRKQWMIRRMSKTQPSTYPHVLLRHVLGKILLCYCINNRFFTSSCSVFFSCFYF